MDNGKPFDPETALYTPEMIEFIKADYGHAINACKQLEPEYQDREILSPQEVIMILLSGACEVAMNLVIGDMEKAGEDWPDWRVQMETLASLGPYMEPAVSRFVSERKGSHD